MTPLRTQALSRTIVPSLIAAVMLTSVIVRGPAVAQSPERAAPADHGVVADDDLTSVIGTRFVANAKADATPKAQFVDARIPLAAFNDTDHCIDQEALAMAREYFDSLGRMLGKAAQFYILPDADMTAVVANCTRQTGAPPKAWVESTTKVIAFGQVVPTTEAAKLEEAIR